MERMLVVVVDNIAKANDASRALEEFDVDSVIAVFASRIISKSADGTVTVIDTHDSLPQASMGGTAVGSLIGLLGGPIGLAIGAATGLALGASADYFRNRVAGDFVADVKDALLPGKVAVVAEIDEEETDAVDDRMEALGGFVLRRALSDLADSGYDREIAGIEADIAQTKAEHASSRADRRKHLQSRLDSLNAKLRHALEGRKAHGHALQREAEAKVRHLEQQAAGEEHDIDAKRADRIAAARRRYQEWLDRSESHTH
jgi:uncharacterized membrane protein